MKKVTSLFLFLGMAAGFLWSCGDDDDSAKQVLLTSNRATGQFYTINLSNGKLTEAFKVTYNDETLHDIRAFVYHPGENAFYASLHSYAEFGEGDQKGQLFKVDQETKEATLINNNDGNDGAYDQWDAIVNWAVEEDDSLVAVGDFNNDGNGFVRFGTDGGRSLVTVDADVCCGLGMVYDPQTEEAMVGNYGGEGAVLVTSFNTVTGAFIEAFEFTDFSGFPASFTEIQDESYLPLKGLAQNHDGKYYGILFNDDSQKTYFVSLDFETLIITYISTMGISTGDQYNALTLVSSKDID